MQPRKLLQPVAVLAVLLAAVSVPAHAQYYGSQSQYQNPVQWLFYGGLNVPTGSESSLLNTGWNFGFGAAFRQQGSPLALRLDLDYASNNVSSLARAARAQSCQRGIRIVRPPAYTSAGTSGSPPSSGTKAQWGRTVL